MKARILLLAAGIATLASCSSLYKTGQTPDDVYYSPARPVVAADDYVQNENSNGYQSYQQYQDAYRDDRFLRMSVGNPYYLSAYNMYDGFDWRYNAYSYYDSSPWSNYWSWNNYYNPYTYCLVPIGGFSSKNYITPISKPVAFNGHSYNSSSSGGSYQSGPRGVYFNPGSSGPRYNNSNSYSPSGSNNNSNSGAHNNTTYTPTRSYSPSPSPSSGGSSSGGGGGGGGGVSRPTRN